MNAPGYNVNLIFSFGVFVEFLNKLIAFRDGAKGRGRVNHVALSGKSIPGAGV